MNIETVYACTLVFMVAACSGAEDGSMSSPQSQVDMSMGGEMAMVDAAGAAGGDGGMAGESNSGGPSESPDILISEVMTSNEVSLLDEAGEADDWFEIVNLSEEVVDLVGWGLTIGHDTGEAPYIVPETVLLEAGEYIIIWADKDEEQGPLHADFKLSRGDGEILTLLNPEGAVVDAVDVPVMETDESYARVGTTDDWIVTTEPTPGVEND
ncbi:MAG: hypothetical protein CMH52_10850 [Myxococcales bacterium]|nr:hypothetical protein [Myxococcales bacterium]